MISIKDLDRDQLMALERATRFVNEENARVFWIAGYAGSGKTTVAGFVAGCFPKAIIVAPTACAAAVLKGKLDNAGIVDREVLTIHAAIKMFKLERTTDDGRAVLDWTDKKKPPYWRLVILDECSMVNINLMKDLLRHCRQVVAFGDPGQLPPIENAEVPPEERPAYFVDVVTVPGQHKPDAVLEEIHRQGAGSGIIQQANRIRLTGQCADDGPEFRLITAESYEDVAWDLTEADTVLCPTHAIRGPLVKFLREQRGFDGPVIQAGEPLTCRSNNYKIGVYNGGQYIVEEDRSPGRTLQIIDPYSSERFRVERAIVEMAEPVQHAGKRQRGWTKFDLGYAGTVHSAQGNEWRNVVIVGYWPGREDRNRWLYTAVTRASQSVILLTIETAAEAEYRRLMFEGVSL